MRVEPVAVGLTNTIYRLTFETETWMLRIAAASAPRIGIDHDREIGVHRRAADAGIAPRVIHAEPGTGVLVTVWVPGGMWTAERLHSAIDRERLTGLLAQVHGMPLCGSVFAPPRLAESYARLLSRESSLYADCRRAANELERAPDAAELCCCHNDLIAANIVGEAALKLVDWEYASDNDPAFDLASLIEFHDLEETVANSLVDSYAPNCRLEWRERVDWQRRIYVQLALLWCAAYGDLADENTVALARRMQESCKR